jgi:predicted ATP-binding protein involved in virulence
MIISDIEILGVGGIQSINIPLHSRMNIICGPNGIGKTTILECVAHLLSHGNSSILKRHVNSQGGSVSANFKLESLEQKQVKIQINSFNPNENNQISGDYGLSKFILSLKTTRTFAYTALAAVSKDTEKPDHVMYTEAQAGISLQDTKNWFVNRYLYSAHKNALSAAQMANFEIAKQCFSQLNSEFSFLRVNAATNEIMVNTPTGELYYEYLSSGFKSCLSIMFGIMKEIEYRFPNTEVAKFEGIVLIDELELHLHPEWQSRIVPVLLNIFPSLQFITTTHSPHIIQNADRHTIIALERKNNEIVKRELPSTVYGFKGWTVEEVLEDVMGMVDTRTTLFTSLIERFGVAIDKENMAEAELIYTKLDELLHPSNSMRKIARLQLAGIGVKVD